MGLASEIMEFFYIQNAPTKNSKIHPRTLTDFVNKHPQYDGRIFELVRVCKQLLNNNFLFSAGYAAKKSPPLHEAFYSFYFDHSEAAYGVYDFIAYGFVHIYQHFEKSVKPVVVQKKNGDEDIGTGFLLDNHRFITAGHCIEDMKFVQIGGWNPKRVKLETIMVPTNSNIDLAVLQFRGNPFFHSLEFNLMNAAILEDVMIMGYPQIPGFKEIQVVETSQIGGYLKSSIGQIVAHEDAYLDRQMYYLINAKVRGGSSGSPVINRQGKVVGVIVRLPQQVQDRMDTLEYGIAIPYKILNRIIETCDKKNTSSVREIRFTTINNGVSTIV